VRSALAPKSGTGALAEAELMACCATSSISAYVRTSRRERS
jgi:hypothetical protein